VLAGGPPKVASGLLSAKFPPGSNFYYATGLLSAQTSQSTIDVLF